MRCQHLHDESLALAHGVFPDADLIECRTRVGAPVRPFDQARVVLPTRRQPGHQSSLYGLSVDQQRFALICAAHHPSLAPELAHELHLKAHKPAFRSNREEASIDASPNI
jgi:hypothetical protein